MSYILTLLITFILSVVLTGVVRSFALSRGLVFAPRARDSHKKPLPRIGGVAIFTSFLLVSLIYFAAIAPGAEIAQGHWFGLDKKIVGIWLASLVVVTVMLIDDLKGLSALVKLFFQLIAVGVIIASGIGIDFLSNPFGPAINLNSVYIPVNLFGTTYHFSLWSDLLTAVWLIGMMNVVNFIDGVDGLAAGISAIAAVVLFFLSLGVGQPAVAIISIILAAATLGFLLWNFYPAKIFMGALEKRQEMMRKISELAAHRQADFIEKGVSYLKPLTMEETAGIAGVHVSTVSRAIANKFVQSPRGIFPLKFLFSAPVTKGGQISSRSVKERIARLIEGEDTTNPLSDEQAALRLKSEGIDISRRAVAKYRAAMNISSTFKRRTTKKSL